MALPLVAVPAELGPSPSVQPLWAELNVGGGAKILGAESGDVGVLPICVLPWVRGCLLYILDIYCQIASYIMCTRLLDFLLGICSLVWLMKSFRAAAGLGDFDSDVASLFFFLGAAGWINDVFKLASSGVSGRFSQHLRSGVPGAMVILRLLFVSSGFSIAFGC